MLRIARVSRQLRMQPNALGLRGARNVSVSGFATISDNNVDAALRENVKNLGSILGDCVKLQDPAAFEKVEKLRKLGRQVRKYNQQKFHLKLNISF